MSYVFPLTLMLAAALSGATYAVFNARKRSRLGCLLGVLTLPVYVVATFRGLMLIDETEAQHVSPSEANRVLCFFRVPSTATDVNCWNSKFGGTRDQADFQIDEPAFLSWIAGLSWEPGEFVTGDDDETKWVDSRRQGREFDMAKSSLSTSHRPAQSSTKRTTEFASAMATTSTPTLPTVLTAAAQWCTTGTRVVHT